MGVRVLTAYIIQGLESGVLILRFHGLGFLVYGLGFLVKGLGFSC